MPIVVTFIPLWSTPWLWGIIRRLGDVWARGKGQRLVLALSDCTKMNLAYSAINNNGLRKHINGVKELFQDWTSHYEQRSWSFYTISRVVSNFHGRRGYLFWSDVSVRKIVRANLDGSQPEVIADGGVIAGKKQ